MKLLDSPTQRVASDDGTSFLEAADRAIGEQFPVEWLLTSGRGARLASRYRRDSLSGEDARRLVAHQQRVASVTDDHARLARGTSRPCQYRELVGARSLLIRQFVPQISRALAVGVEPPGVRRADDEVMTRGAHLLELVHAVPFAIEQEAELHVRRDARRGFYRALDRFAPMPRLLVRELSLLVIPPMSSGALSCPPLLRSDSHWDTARRHAVRADHLESTSPTGIRPNGSEALRPQLVRQCCARPVDRNEHRAFVRDPHHGCLRDRRHERVRVDPGVLEEVVGPLSLSARLEHVQHSTRWSLRHPHQHRGGSLDVPAVRQTRRKQLFVGPMRFRYLDPHAGRTGLEPHKFPRMRQVRSIVSMAMGEVGWGLALQARPNLSPKICGIMSPPTSHGHGG